MGKMLITMIDGGMVKYEDDSWHIPGCPTCNYGSSYITEIDITLTCYKVRIKIDTMYTYALSEGDMMRIFLSEYDGIKTMTENEFIDWLKEKLLEIVSDDDLEEYYVTEL